MATTIVNVHPTASLQAWQIAANQDIWTVMTQLASLGYTMTVQCSPVSPNNSAQFQVIISFPGLPNQIGTPGYWIVWGTQSANLYTSAQATSMFTVG